MVREVCGIGEVEPNASQPNIVDGDSFTTSMKNDERGISAGILMARTTSFWGLVNVNCQGGVSEDCPPLLQPIKASCDIRILRRTQPSNYLQANLDQRKCRRSCSMLKMAPIWRTGLLYLFAALHRTMIS